MVVLLFLRLALTNLIAVCVTSVEITLGSGVGDRLLPGPLVLRITLLEPVMSPIARCRT